MLDPGTIDHVLPIARPDDFFVDAHAKIYDAILALRKDGKDVSDVGLVALELKQRGQLEAMGGVDGLGELLRSVPVASHAIHYAEKVRDAAVRRSVIRAAASLRDNAYDSTTKPEMLRHAATEIVQKAALLDSGENIGKPKLTCLADVEATAIEWLWPERVAMGKLTLVSGDPGLGKSLVTLNMAARVSTGMPWPDRSQTPIEAGSVVLLRAEDDPSDTIKPRLVAAGADVSRIHVLEAVEWYDSERKEKVLDPVSLQRDLSALEDAIRGLKDCRLVIVDPVSAYLGDADAHKNAEVRAVLTPLADLARRLRVAVVMIDHLNKGNGPAIYRSMGSVAFVATVRSAWTIIKDKNNPERRLMLPLKSNIATDMGGRRSRTPGACTTCTET